MSSWHPTALPGPRLSLLERLWRVVDGKRVPNRVRLSLGLVRGSDVHGARDHRGRSVPAKQLAHHHKAAPTGDLLVCWETWAKRQKI